MIRNKPKIQSTLIATLVILLFTLLTLADAPRPDYGIINLFTYNEQIVADDSFDIFCSTDGGFTWKGCVYSDGFDNTSLYHELPYTIQIPDSQTKYHLSESGVVTISEDAGETWHRLEKSNYFSDVAQYYQEQTRPNAYIYNPGAQDMVYDPESGNVIIAMGLQGVIVIPQEGKAIQVGIGDNQPAKLYNPLVIVTIILPFLLLAAAYIAICYGTLITISRHFWYWVLNLAALIVWTFFALSFQGIFSGYAIVIGLPALVIFAVLFILLLVKSESTLKKLGQKNKHYKINLLKKVMPGGLVYFLCYLLWYLGIIPKRDWALYISLAVTVGWFIYCVIQSYKWNNQAMDAA